MAFDLMKDASKRIIVAAHRGESGDNIPCNTIPAYEIAVRHGADMIEVDVSQSADGMLDQIVVKSAPKAEVLNIVEEYAPEVYYLPIIKKDDGIHEEMMRRRINYVGCEVVFTDETTGVGSTDFIEKLHLDRKLVWANAIIYNYKDQLAAGHSDDTSFTVSPEYGWGWLADRGYDIIQTDWTLAMCSYLNESGKRFKK